MPTVEYDGKTYSLLRRDTVVPNLQTMDRIAALVWLTQNTKARGYQRPVNPLKGYGGTVTSK